MFCLFQLLSAMLGKMDKDDGPLPQDLTEGCDDDEWVGYRIIYKGFVISVFCHCKV